MKDLSRYNVAKQGRERFLLTNSAAKVVKALTNNGGTMTYKQLGKTTKISQAALYVHVSRLAESGVVNVDALGVGHLASVGLAKPVEFEALKVAG